VQVVHKVLAREEGRGWRAALEASAAAAHAALLEALVGQEVRVRA